MEKIIIRNKSFFTESGKQVLLHGINVVCKEKECGYFFPDLEKSFQAFRNMGFNLIRFGIFWDGVEPQPGCYDDIYLKKVKNTIQLAEQYDLYVLLDMHQDLFARKYADGAPDWATLDEGAEHPQHCTMWYNAYLESEAVIRAADNFWADRPAEDGIGLMEHYSAMWGEIAKQFADCVNIIGFEPMNEPFMGSLARDAFAEADRKMKEQYLGFDVQNPEEVSDEQQEMYMQIVEKHFQKFDQTVLMDFYRRMRTAICKYSDKAIVTGGNIYCSSTVRTGIERLDEAGYQIYAPHGYDSVVDSDRYENYSMSNIERLFADKKVSQDKLALPVIIGEWGAFPSKEFTNDLIRHMNGILEKYLWSSSYWEYHPGMEDDENYHSLCRSYPAETAGVLTSYRYIEQEKCLEMDFEAEVDGISKIYCSFIPQQVKCTALFSYEIKMITDETCFIRLRVKEDKKTKVLISGK